MRIFLSLLGCCIFYSSTVSAAGDGSAGFRFLTAASSVEGVAIAGALTSLASGTQAVAFNPAGLTLADGTGFSAGYLTRPLDLRSGEVGIAPVSVGDYSLGFRVFYTTTPEVPVTDETGNFTGGYFRGTDLSASAAAARLLFPWLAAGATAKFVYSGIDGQSARALAVDIGLLGRSGSLGARAAVVLRHIGLWVRDFNERECALPTALAVSASIEPLKGRLHLGIGLDFTRDREATVTLGGRIRPVTPVYIDFGYVTGWQGAGWPLEVGPGVGFGLVIDRASFSYAFRELGRLGNENALGLTFYM